MNALVIVGSAAVVASLFVAWWAVGGTSSESVDLGSAASTDYRTRVLEQGASERLGGPLLDRFGAMVRRWSPTGRVSEMSRKLASAGSPPGWTVERLLAAKVLLSLALGLLTGLALAGNLSPLGVLLIVAAALFGFLIPEALLTRRIERRNEAIRAQLSGVIDQLSMMVQAGLGIDAAIARSARTNTGPLADELTRVGHDVRVGIERSVALANLAERSDVPELRTFISALTQAERLGVSVSQTLDVQAKEMRLKRRQAAEEQAMKLPVKLLFPMVFCILPVLMIVILAPAGMKILETLE